MRGSGKSAVGRALAEELNRIFIDTDHEIESRAGTTTAEIFSTQGEDAFREIESAVLRDLIARENERVISLGGGAILRAENRELLTANCIVVLLHAPIEVLANRIKTDDSSATRRPTLTDQSSLADELQSLWTARETLYHSTAHVTCDTDGRTVAEVVAAILAAVPILKTE